METPTQLADKLNLWILQNRLLTLSSLIAKDCEIEKIGQIDFKNEEFVIRVFQDAFLLPIDSNKNQTENGLDHTIGHLREICEYDLGIGYFFDVDIRIIHRRTKEKSIAGLELAAFVRTARQIILQQNKDPELKKDEKIDPNEADSILKGQIYAMSCFDLEEKTKIAKLAGLEKIKMANLQRNFLSEEMYIDGYSPVTIIEIFQFFKEDEEIKSHLRKQLLSAALGIEEYQREHNLSDVDLLSFTRSLGIEDDTVASSKKKK